MTPTNHPEDPVALVRRGLLGLLAKEIVAQHMTELQALALAGAAQDETVRILLGPIDPAYRAEIAEHLRALLPSAPPALESAATRPQRRPRRMRSDTKAAHIRSQLDAIAAARGWTEVHLPDHPDVVRVVASQVPWLATMPYHAQLRALVEAYARRLSYPTIESRAGKRFVVWGRDGEGAVVGR